MQTFFREFLQLLFPQVFERVDWTRPPEFLSTNLYRLAPRARGKRWQSVDLLVKVYFRDGKARIVLIHIEIQAQPDPLFPLRMFVYYYHIFDDYDYADVVSLAVLADSDPNWRPASFERSVAGCNLQFEFPIVKLLDLEETELEQSDNPFALVVLAHLRALKTRGKPDLLMQEKIAVIRAMQDRGYTSEQVIALYKVVDYMITLSPEQEKLVKQVVRKFQEGREWPLTSLEEIAIEEGARKGVQQGIQQGIAEAIIRFLHARFGDAALELAPAIRAIDSLEQLSDLNIQAARVSSLEEFAHALNRSVEVQQTPGGGS